MQGSVKCLRSGKVVLRNENNCIVVMQGVKGRLYPEVIKIKNFIEISRNSEK